MEIIIEGLSKVYPNGKQALKNINLTIGQGMFGLLGPNGAGKSTLMRILVTLMKPSAGKVSINGLDLAKDRGHIRKKLGYLPQDFRFFTKLKTWEFLDYAASLAGIKNARERRHTVDKLLDQVGLFDARDKSANNLSGGMKRRLGIAQAIINEPTILIVDEPTTGLDPEERIRFRNILSDLSQKEVIIILSTHIVGDISSVCRELALINLGEVAFQGSPSDFISETKGHVWEMCLSGQEFDKIKNDYSVISTIPSENYLEVQVVGSKLNGNKGAEIMPNLEHAYVYYIEHKLNKI